MNPSHPPKTTPPRPSSSPADRNNPRILLIADVPGWVFDRHATILIDRLGDSYRFSKIYQGQPFREDEYDLIYPLEFNLVTPGQISRPEKFVTAIRSHVTWSAWDFAELVRYLAGHFQRVHVVSRRLLNIFSPYLPGVTYVGNGIETARFIPSRPEDLPDEPVRLGWVGNRNQALKGFERFIKPLGDLPGIELHTLSYQDRELAFADMPDYYRSVDIYVCASSFEGSNNPLFEAALMECAIITTDQGTVPEFLQDGYNARILPRDLNAFQAAVLELREDSTTRRELGQRARQAVLQGRWDWDDKAEEFRVLFQIALEHRSTYQTQFTDRKLLEQRDPEHLLSVVQDQWRLETELRENLSDVVQALQDSQAAHYLARIEGQESYIGELEAERKHLYRYIQELEGRLAALNENSFSIRALKKLKIIKAAQEQ